MRIALVGPTHPLKGGVAQHTTALAQRLAAAGHDVQIVSWLRQYPQRLYPGNQAVDAPEFPPFVPTRRVLSWNRPDTWLRVARQLRDLDLVVFAYITPVQVPPYRIMLAGLRNGQARAVVICHNVLPHERGRFDERLVGQLLGAADGVLVHSEAEAAIARRLTGAPIAVARIAPHLPPAFVQRHPLPGEHRRLLFFGLVRPYKGLDVAMHALANGPPDVRLRIAGEFWGGVEAIENLAQELGIADRVELRSGYVAAADVPELFRDVDALILPYRSATGSQGVWTGFEFGVPVIATRAGHLADDIRDGVDGLVAEPDDVDSFASVIERLYQPGLPEQMRSNVKPVDPEPYWHKYLAALLEVGPVDPVLRERKPQLAYSQTQAKMTDEPHRRVKARKIISVLHNFLGSRDLAGLTAVDIGCSVGFIADELANDGAEAIGIDIDAPGLRRAQSRFGSHVRFVCTSGDALPFPEESVDVVVFNHIYEHVVDPDAVLTEIHRVLKGCGVAYLGLGNKYQIIEPHYRLPFLSWLPQRAADGYVRRFGRADEYYERYRSRSGLKQMLRGFHVWDYTVPVVKRPDLFSSADQVGSLSSRVPAGLIRMTRPVIPTYIWVATKGGTRPRGALAARTVEHMDLSANSR